VNCGHTIRAITHDFNDYSDLNISANGHLVATVLNQYHFDLFVTPASDLSSGQARQLTSGAGVFRFAWTLDSQVILGQQDALSLFHPDTGSMTPLTSPQQEGVAFQPSACADGLYVVFSMLARGEAKATTIWRMDAGVISNGSLTARTIDIQPAQPMGNGFITSIESTRGLPGHLWKEGNRKVSPRFPDMARWTFLQTARWWLLPRP
jgi:hypothetical protein